MSSNTSLVIIKGPSYLGNCIQSSVNSLNSFVSKTYGFYSDENLVLDSEQVQQMMSVVPENIKEIIIEDKERGILWIPLTMDSQFSSLYPELIEKNGVKDWRWVVTPYLQLTEEEAKEQGVKPEDIPFVKVLDLDSSEYFEKNNYEQAINFMSTYDNEMINELQLVVNKKSSESIN